MLYISACRHQLNRNKTNFDSTSLGNRAGLNLRLLQLIKNSLAKCHHYVKIMLVDVT